MKVSEKLETRYNSTRHVGLRFANSVNNSKCYVFNGFIS